MHLYLNSRDHPCGSTVIWKYESPEYVILDDFDFTRGRLHCTYTTDIIMFGNLLLPMLTAEWLHLVL
jgi:hypothetical protein